MARKSKRIQNSRKKATKRENIKAQTPLKTNISKLIKNRLTSITNLVHKHINNAKKRISTKNAQKYLQELDSMKVHCKSNVHYLQVHEKLSKQMSLIIMGKDKLKQEPQSIAQHQGNELNEILSTKSITNINREQVLGELRSTQTTPSDILNMDDIIDLTGDLNSLDDIVIDKPYTNFLPAINSISFLCDTAEDLNETNYEATTIANNITEFNYNEKTCYTAPTACTNEEFITIICDDHNYFRNSSLTKPGTAVIANNNLLTTTSKGLKDAEYINNETFDSNAPTPEVFPYISSYPIKKNDVIIDIDQPNHNLITSIILDIEGSIINEDNLQISVPKNNSHINLLYESTNDNNSLSIMELNNVVNEGTLNNSNEPREYTKENSELKNKTAKYQENSSTATPMIDTSVNYNVEAVNSVTNLITDFEALETEYASDLKSQCSENLCQVPDASNSNYKKNYANEKHDDVTNKNTNNNQDGVDNTVLTINTLNSGDNTKILNSEIDWIKDLKFIRDINDSEYFSNTVLPEGFWSNESLPKEWEADFDIWD